MQRPAPMLISLREAAEITGIHRNTLNRLFKEGKLPFAQRLGHRIYLHRERFEEWFAQGGPQKEE